MLSRLSRLRRRGNAIPFRSDLVQHLFRDSNPITSDGLFAKDYSGLGNHAPLKQSFQMKTKVGVDAILTLPSPISFANTDNWSFECYFRQDDVTTTESFTFLGNVSGTQVCKIWFRPNSGVYIYDDGGVNALFVEYTQFKVLRKYKLVIHDGVVDYYVNDAFVQSKAFVFTTYTATHLTRAKGVAASNGEFFDIKITKNNVLTHYWPCQEGSKYMYNVVDGSVLAVPTATYHGLSYQDLSHYNLINGCDLYTNHDGEEIYVPKKLDGTMITPVVDVRYWTKFNDRVLPFPICETTIQTLQGDIKHRTLEHNVGNKIFADISLDQTYKDILVYGTTKNQTEAKRITDYLKYGKYEAYTYNNSVLATISDIIKTGSAKVLGIGDSLSPICYHINEQLRNYCTIKGLGFSVYGTGNYPQNIYGDIWTSHTGTFDTNTTGATDELFGLNGFSFTMKPGSTMNTLVFQKKYTNIRILYAQNTDKGSFDLVITGVGTYTINCNGTKGLGIYSLNVAETSATITVQNFTGDVIIYGFELNNSGAITHLLSHGGYTTRSFNSTIYPSYLAQYCSLTALDYAIIMLGANDATTPDDPRFSIENIKLNIKQLISDIKTDKPNLPVILLTPTTRANQWPNPTGEDLNYWERSREIVEMYKDVCDEETNVCLIDYGLIFPRYSEAVAKGYMLDIIHHTTLGNEFSAREIYKTLINS